MRKIWLFVLAMAVVVWGADTTGTDASGGGVKLDSAARYSWNPAAPTVFTSGNVLLIFNTGSANATAAGNFYLKKLTTTADYSGALSWAAKNCRFENGLVHDGTGSLTVGSSDTITGDGMLHHGSGSGTYVGTNTILFQFNGMDTIDIDKAGQMISRKIIIVDTTLITNASTMLVGQSTTAPPPVVHLKTNALLVGNQAGVITATTGSTLGSGSPWRFESGAWLDGTGAWTFTSGGITAANIPCSTFSSRGTGAIIIQPSLAATSDSMTWYGNATFGISQPLQWKPHASAATPHWFFMNRKNLKAGALTVGSNNASQTLNQHWSTDTVTTQSMTMTSTGTDSAWLDTVQWHCTGAWTLPAFSGSDKWNPGISQVWFDSSTKSIVTSAGNAFYDRYVNKTSAAICSSADSCGYNKYVGLDGVLKGVNNGMSVADSFSFGADVDSIDGISGAKKWIDLTGADKVFAYHTPDAKARTDSLGIWFKESHKLYYSVEPEFRRIVITAGKALDIYPTDNTDTIHLRSYTAQDWDNARIRSGDTTYWDNPAAMVLSTDTLKNQWFKSEVLCTTGCVDSGGNTNVVFSGGGTPTLTMANHWHDWMVLQRDRNTDSLNLTLAGTTTGTLDSVVAWVEDYSNDTLKQDTLKIDGTVSGAYSGTYKVRTGAWDEVHVAAMAGGAVVAEDSSNKIGIGMVFPMLGQSNMYGAQSGIVYTVADTHSSMYTPDSGYQYLHDPTHGLGGTCAPALANWLMDSAEIPSMVIPVAVSGSALVNQSTYANWGKRFDANHFRTTDTYGNAIYQTRAATDTGKVEGFLWLQGEADALSSVPRKSYVDTFNLLYSRLCEDVNSDSAPMYIMQIGRRYTAGDDTAYANVRQALADLDSSAHYVLSGTTMDLAIYDSNVHFTGRSEDSIGNRFANSILHQYDSTTWPNYRGPHIDSAKYDPLASKRKVVIYKTNAGTATAPTTGYTGWEFYNGSTWSTAIDSSRADSLYFPADATKIRYMFARNPVITGIIKDNTALALPMEPIKSMDIGGTAKLTILSITPATSDTAGGDTASLSWYGAGTTPGTITINGDTLTVLTWTDSTGTAIFPAEAAGVYDLIVANNGEAQIDTLEGAVTYTATAQKPVILSLKHPMGRIGYADTTIGTYFGASGGSAVLAGTAVTITHQTDDTLIWTVPTKTRGTYNWIYTNPEGLKDTVQFRVLVPWINILNP